MMKKFVVIELKYRALVRQKCHRHSHITSKIKGMFSVFQTSQTQKTCPLKQEAWSSG